jgi:hypothetical protein
VAVLGSGGLSHQLDGERAGFINKAFDLQFLESLESNPEWATQFSDPELVEKAGTQGVELLMWLAMRGAHSAGAPVCARCTATTTSRFPTPPPGAGAGGGAGPGRFQGLGSRPGPHAPVQARRRVFSTDKAVMN